jgi:anti-anti-sigma factor
VGDLDSATAPLLETCLSRIDGNLEVDCSGLDFVGAHGVKVLMDARARCDRTEASFKLLAPTPMLRRIVLITGLGSS